MLPNCCVSLFSIFIFLIVLGFVKFIVIEHNVYLNFMRTKGDCAVMTEITFSLMGFCSARMCVLLELQFDVNVGCVMCIIHIVTGWLLIIVVLHPMTKQMTKVCIRLFLSLCSLITVEVIVGVI